VPLFRTIYVCNKLIYIATAGSPQCVHSCISNVTVFSPVQTQKY